MKKGLSLTVEELTDLESRSLSSANLISRELSSAKRGAGVVDQPRPVRRRDDQ